MANINTVAIVGRLTRDMDFSYTSSNVACGKIAIACDELRKGEKYTNFFDVVLWGKPAENLKPYLTKGKQIAISGRLHQDRWEKDGQRRSAVNIIAAEVQLLGGDRQQSTQPQQQNTDEMAAGYPEDILF